MNLIETFHVNVEAHDLQTAETIMHIACQNKSKLRFYLVKHHPCLLRKRDVGGRLPLHIACSNNDITFISWLFGKILALEGDGEGNSTLTSIVRARSMSDILSPSNFIPPNRSLQAYFPTSPANLMNALTPIVPTNHVPLSDYVGEGEDDVDFTPPHTPSLHEQGLILSFENNRSFTFSGNGSSRSGSSERSFPIKFPIQAVRLSSASISSDDMTDSHCNGSHENDNEETSCGNDLCDNAIFGVMSANQRSDVTHLNGSSSVSQNCSISVNSERDIDDPSVMPLHPEEASRLLDLQNTLSQHPLSIADIVDMKPFSMDEKGDTIFHILARNNSSELLTVIFKVADFLKHRVKLDLLVNREGFHSRLPIEEALYVKSDSCVQQLIQLSVAAGLMPKLLMDPHIIKCAVFVNDIQLVKILIEYGFHQGLKPALSLAIISEYHEILRILLFWQTQVINSSQFARMKKSGNRKQLLLDSGVVNWEEIQLEGVQYQWIADAFAATNSVSKLLRLSCLHKNITEKCFEYFKLLGSECLKYFDNLTYPLPPKSFPVPFAPITEVNISENQLRCVPVELFQMQHLRVLRLSHNALAELPSSLDFNENVYTSQLVKLDLNWNDLSELPEDMFRGLALSLRELSVQYNQLEKLPPGLWVMPKLKKVKLAHNKLEKLHTLSHSCYFCDIETSKTISTFYETNDQGDLICTSSKDSLKMQQCTKYLKRLANFYITVCAVRGLNFNLKDDFIFQEVLDIHTARYNKLRCSNDEQENTNFLREPQILRIFEEEEELECAIKCTMDLDLLDLSYNKFKNFPWDLACISPKLQKLDLRGNVLTLLDVLHSVPSGLHSLILLQNGIASLNKARSFNLPCGNPMRLLCIHEDMVPDGYCQHCNHSTLEKLSSLMLDHNRLDYFPIVGTPLLEAPDIGNGFSDYDIIRCDTYYPDLSILSLANNKFSAVPKHLDHLVHLSSLNISFNNIVELPLDMGLMNNLLLLKLDGLFLRNIPGHLLGKPQKLLHHLKALKQK